jgi:hypothetical protein
MSKKNSQKTTTVKGNSNVVGDSNKINSPTIVQHVHNRVINNVRSDKRGNDAIGFLLSVGFAVITGIWLFFKHSADLYFYVKLAALVAVALVILTLLVRVVWSDLEGPTVVDFIASIILAILLFAAAVYSEQQLHP